MQRLKLWHGSRHEIDAVDLSRTVDGGFHLGDQAQARARTGQAGFLHEIEAAIGPVRRCRDTGGNWKDKIRDARARRYDAIVYLNRYEGIPSARIEELSASGMLDKLDGLGDAAFRRLVPEARDSHIILHASDIRILRVLRPQHELTKEPSDPAPG